MKLTPRILSCLAIAVAASLSAHAQSVVTDPVGFISITVKPINTTYPANNPTGLNYISLGLPRSVAYQSLVPSGTGLGASTNGGGTTTLTFAPNTFTAGQFGSGGSFYLEIINGTDAGKIADITSTTTNSLVLDANLTSSIINGTTNFRIRPYWTLATAFGATNTAGFQPANGLGNVATADLIQTVSRTDGTVTSYFFNNASGVNQWQNATTGANASNLTIDPDEGLQVLRRGAGDLTFKLAGDVKTGPTEILLSRRSNGEAVNVVANPYALESVMLMDSRLNNVVTGGTASTADTVRILDPVRNTFNDFFYETSTSKWKSGFTDASLVVIPPGAGVRVTRRAGTTTSTSWMAPQPSMVLGDTPLPLTLVSAVSRKSHGAYGTADVNLPLSGPIGIESRNFGTGNTMSVVFTFTNNIQGYGSPVLSGTGTIASSSVSGKSITISLTGVSDVQNLNVSIPNITDTNSQALSSASAALKVLVADTNQSSSNTGADVAFSKSVLSPGEVLFSNFRADLNNSGTLTGADVALAKTKVGNSIP